MHKRQYVGYVPRQKFLHNVVVLITVDSTHAVAAITWSFNACFFKYVGQPFPVECVGNVVPSNVIKGYIAESIHCWMSTYEIQGPFQLIIYR